MLRIKELREKRGMSQEELAKKSGVSRTTISKLESGAETVAKTTTLGKIAEALSVSVDKIF